MRIHTITLYTLLTLSSIAYSMDGEQKEQKRAKEESSDADELAEKLAIKTFHHQANRPIITGQSLTLRSLFSINRNPEFRKKIFLYQGERGDQGTLLHLASQHPSSVMFSELFLHGAGVALNVPNSQRETPLMVLIRRKEDPVLDGYYTQVDAVEQLLESKADPNGRYMDRSTPLITVLKKDDITHKHRLVQLLIKARANVHDTDAEGHHALYYAEQDAKNIDQQANAYDGWLRWLYKPSIESAQATVTLIQKASLETQQPV